MYRSERHDWPGVEVGWVLRPDWWGCGYATVAGMAAVLCGFEELGEKRLFSCILFDNHWSQAVARRLRFQLVEERAMSILPAEVHGIYALDTDPE